MDNDLEFHYFQENSIANEDEYVAEGNNFLVSRGWGTDDYYEKTRVIAIGRNAEGLPIVYTAISPNEGDDIREVFINDSSANTYDKVKNIAEAKLEEITNRQTQAMIESYGLETLKPGENIWIVVPRQKIYGLYKAIQITHNFGAKSGGWRTRLLLEEEMAGLSRSIQSINQKSDRAVEVDNIKKLNYSWNFEYDEDSGIHSDTEITEGVLKTNGAATGSWISEGQTVSTGVTGVQLKVSGDNLPGTKIRLSTNGGVTYTQIYGAGSKEIVPVGKNLRIRVDLTSANTQIKSMALLYS